MATESSERTLSAKERARQRRREMYQRAKERQAADPRVLALKAQIRERQREARLRAKALRQEAARLANAQRSEKRAAKRAADHQALRKLVQPADQEPSTQRGRGRT